LIDVSKQKFELHFDPDEEEKRAAFIAGVEKIKQRYWEETTRLNRIRVMFSSQAATMLLEQCVLRPVQNTELYSKNTEINERFNQIQMKLLQNVCFMILQGYQKIRGESRVPNTVIQDIYSRCF